MLRRHEKHFVAAGGIVAVLLMPLLQHLPGASAEAPECKSTRGGDDLDRAVRSSEPLGKQTAAALFEVFEATSNLDEGPAVIVHKAALGDAIAHRGRVEIRRLPLGNGRSVALEVEPLRVVGQKTRFVVGRRQTDKNSGIVDVPFPYDTSQVHLFRGKVQGYPESNVVLFESPRRIAGHIDLGPADGRYKLTSQAGSRSVKVRRVDGIPEARPDVPLCGTHFNTSTRGCCDEPPPETTFTKGLKTVELAVETDYDLYENFNDLAVATDYVIELIARTNAIFMRDINTRFEVVFLRLFDNPANEPAFLNSGNIFGDYQNFWNNNMQSVVRDTGILLSGRRDFSFGGVANLGGVCTESGYCVAGYVSGPPNPALPFSGDYDLEVVAHELGHNFEACHTPDYCPFIDRCFPPPVFPQRGTLMSYCSQTVSGGEMINDLWYHTRLRRVMRNFMEQGAAICVSDDCNQNGIDDATDIAGGTSVDVNGNGVPDSCEDCNHNSVLDPADIALGTSLDLNTNAVPDDCEPDCNGNNSPDDRDIALATSADLWGNGVPDECDPDCDGDKVPDYDEIQADLTLDKDRNVVLDSCQDCDGGGIDDLVELLGARNAWVASDVLNQVREFHAISGVRTKTSTGGPVAAAQDLIVAHGNRVLVTSATSHKVVAYHALTGISLGDFVPAGSGGLSYPTGLVIGPNRNLFVCSRNTNAVLQYNGTTGSFLGAFVATGSGGLTIPFGLTFGPDGNLFVTSGGNRVLEFDGTTAAFVRELVTMANNGGLAQARGLLFKPDGNLLVASYSTDALLQFDGTTGAFLGKWNSGGTSGALYLDGPWSLRLGPTGNVFATRDVPSQDEKDPDHDHDDDDHDGGGEPLHVTSARIMEFDIQSGKYVRSFVVGDDTGLVSPTGFDFMPGTFDCNFNMLPDSCDITAGLLPDADGDLIADACDNCPADLNADQADCNQDGQGDLCEVDFSERDGDADTHCNIVDNCPTVANPNQDDTDADTVGNACDNCPAASNPGQEDTDGDGLGDVCDCLVVPYGDVNATGQVDVDDVIYILAGFADPASFPASDLHPCGGDGDVDVDDILALLDAFSGQPACPDACIP